MRCTSKGRLCLIGCMAFAFLYLSGCSGEPKALVTEFEKAHYNTELYESTLYAEELCVAETDVALEGYEGDTALHASSLFDLENKNVLYSWQSHERLYPASTTKIMTALLALENGNLEDTVTISKTAAAASFPSDAQVCGLREGEVWTLEDLLNALLLYSGNDAASAIAEHIAGTEESFVNMMNSRARELMANNTHFTNPHGLHDDEHYTTAYDLYLIFNECIKNEHFVEIISSDSYTAVYTAADGSQQEMTFTPTNLYAKGVVEEPDNVTIVGGKTGTTDEAGCCLILLVRDSQNRPYISIVMGAPDKSTLYEDMTSLIEKIT
ncbi:MAG: serine hydrolase [bacterium]|nr:serine hydrolase [bacterium]MDY5457449.1 serine hydrolase [Bariatricus sp.]